MRADIWARWRSNRFARKLYGIPGLRGALRTLSYWLLPENTRKLCRVERGLGAGLLFELNPRYERSMWEGTYEPEVQLVLGGYLDSETVFYDVGSGIGYFSCVAALRGAMVCAFEPDEGNAACVERHVSLNNLGHRIKVFKEVVSSETGNVRLRSADRSFGHGNAVVVADSDEAALAVHCITLDQFMKTERPATFCKVDVEGHESEVLKGAESLFEVHRPCLLCEIHDERNEEFVLSWLETKSYRVRWLEPQVGVGTYAARHLFALPNSV